jgi:hypothetical protein
MDSRIIYAAMGSVQMSAKYAFVPAQRGRYIRTHICVAFVPCTNCKAQKRRACVSSDGNLTVATCVKRREAYAKYKVAQKKKKLTADGSKA